MRWLDLRSPSEYAIDHVPGSENVPLFDDEQRALVGTLYKQHSPDRAYLEGLQIIKKRLPALLNQVLGQTVDSQQLSDNFEKLAVNLRSGIKKAPLDMSQSLTDNSEIVVYCWRGGMRSRSFVSLLISLGIPAVLLEGGYKSYRNWVSSKLSNYSYPETITLRGRTGVGKTELLALIEKALPNSTLCLESLADHRSSALGAVGRHPVSQKMFDSLLLQRLTTITSEQVFIEGESRKVGDVIIPSGLFSKMQSGAQVHIKASRKFRRNCLQQDYLSQDGAVGQISKTLPFLESRIGKKWLGELQSMLMAGNYDSLIDILLDHYYDPLYDREEHKFNWLAEMHRDNQQIVKDLITIHSRITA